VADLTLELAVPFAQLGLAAEDRFGVQVELCDPGGQPERQPAQTPIALSVPGEDFEAKRWLL